MFRRRTAAIVAVTGLTGLGAAVFATAPRAQTGPATIEITEADATAFAQEDVGKGGLRKGKMSFGDRITLSAPITRNADGAKGTLFIVLTVTTPGRHAAEKVDLYAAGHFAFTDGTLYAQGATDFRTGAGKGAITGGTGVYANARGTLDSPRQSLDVITLAP